MKNKKIIIFSLLLSVLLFLSACGKNGSERKSNVLDEKLAKSFKEKEEKNDLKNLESFNEIYGEYKDNRFKDIDKDKIIEKDYESLNLRAFYDEKTKITYVYTTDHYRNPASTPMPLINNDKSFKEYSELKNDEFLFEVIDNESFLNDENRKNPGIISYEDFIIILKDKQNNMEYLLLVDRRYGATTLIPLYKIEKEK